MVTAGSARKAMGLMRQQGGKWGGAFEVALRAAMAAFQHDLEWRYESRKVSTIQP